jgi:hypothetical protein
MHQNQQTLTHRTLKPSRCRTRMIQARLVRHTRITTDASVSPDDGFASLVSNYQWALVWVAYVWSMSQYGSVNIHSPNCLDNMCTNFMEMSPS